MQGFPKGETSQPQVIEALVPDLIIPLVIMWSTFMYICSWLPSEYYPSFLLQSIQSVHCITSHVLLLHVIHPLYRQSHSSDCSILQIACWESIYQPWLLGKQVIPISWSLTWNHAVYPRLKKPVKALLNLKNPSCPFLRGILWNQAWESREILEKLLAEAFK